MITPHENAVPKIHPATRAVEPDDPMNLHGFEVPGDPELMLQVLVEEYARLGYGLDRLMQLFRDPFYQGFHGLWKLYGDEELRRRVSVILSQCGVIRTRTHNTAPAPQQLVELTLPGTCERRNDDA